MRIRLKAIIGMTAGLVCAGTVFGQKAERRHIREGNRIYRDTSISESKRFTEAEIAYRKSVDVNPRSVEGAYDLGNALYRQQKYPEAAEQYQLVAGQSERLLSENREANAVRLAQVYHNLGNIGMQGKEYAKSVEAYKQSLRLNPKDDETRYNLALAQKLLDDQQQQDQDQQQNEDQQEQEQQEQQQNQDQDQKTQEQPQPDER
ncbi:MAG: tetratricopeptide repeat protein, partial [Tannerella sp.]|nr:tetratricopeptide repeat protein [Tannerella sp.]